VLPWRSSVTQVGTKVFEKMQKPLEIEGQHASALRFGDPRVQALLSVRYEPFLRLKGLIEWRPVEVAVECDGRTIRASPESRTTAHLCLGEEELTALGHLRIGDSDDDGASAFEETTLRDRPSGNSSHFLIRRFATGSSDGGSV
jgi:hypothetical protein